MFLYVVFWNIGQSPYVFLCIAMSNIYAARRSKCDVRARKSLGSNFKHTNLTLQNTLYIDIHMRGKLIVYTNLVGKKFTFM